MPTQPLLPYLPAHHCAECAREVARLVADFEAAVAAGAYDRQGYTPAEAKAARRRGTYREWR